MLSILVLVSGLFLGGLGVYRNITKQFASADSSTSFDLDNAEIVALSLITVDSFEEDPLETKSVTYILFDKSKNKVVSFDVPLDLEIDVPGRFGTEQMSKVLQIGMLDSGDVTDGVAYVNETLKRVFAYNVDRYILVEESHSTPVSDAFVFGKSGGLLNYDTLSDLIFSVETDSSLSELYGLYSFVNSLPSDRFIHHENSSEFFMDSGYTDAILRDMTFDSVVAEEKSSVAVLNGTDIPGMASFASRVIQNSSAHVISVENARSTYQESVIITKSNDLASLKEIQRFFRVDNVVSSGSLDNNEPVADRADITLIIGFDIAGIF